MGWGGGDVGEWIRGVGRARCDWLDVFRWGIETTVGIPNLRCRGDPASRFESPKTPRPSEGALNLINSHYSFILIANPKFPTSIFTPALNLPQPKAKTDTQPPPTPTPQTPTRLPSPDTLILTQSNPHPTPSNTPPTPPTPDLNPQSHPPNSPGRGPPASLRSPYWRPLGTLILPQDLMDAPQTSRNTPLPPDPTPPFPRLVIHIPEPLSRPARKRLRHRCAGRTGNDWLVGINHRVA